MKKSLIFFCIFTLSINLVPAQERYYEHFVDEISSQTLTYAYKDGQDLDLDIYYPEFDSETERMTIVYIHGGGFQDGVRDSESIKSFCKELAGYGYVVASISYRLTRKGEETGFGCDCPATDKLNTFYAAVEDVQDAVYFLIQNREVFGIDPYKVILAGNSAGAETALNAAYQPPYCYDLESGPVSYAGVIGIAGAIPDTISLYEESAIPSLLIHGTDDQMVPYGTAPHHFCEEDDPGYLMLYGSATIAQKLSGLDVPYWLYTVCGGNHDVATRPMSDYLEEIVDFGYFFIAKGEQNTRLTVVEDNNVSDGETIGQMCLQQ